MRLVFSRSTWEWDRVKLSAVKPVKESQQGGGVSPYLDPLGAVVVGGRPSVCLAVLVQTGEVRVPGEAVDAPGAEGAGGGDLPV